MTAERYTWRMISGFVLRGAGGAFMVATFVAKTFPVAVTSLASTATAMPR